MDHRLRRRERMTHRREFERLRARRCRVQGTWLVLAGCENGLEFARIGLAVGKRWGKAHQRVRLKRWFREAFRLSKVQVAVGIDYLLMPNHIEGLRFEHVLAEFPKLANKLAAKLARTCARDVDGGDEPKDRLASLG